MTNFDAFILIGGKSSRLGQPKAMVEVGGRTLAERTLTSVRHALNGKVTMVAGNSVQLGIQAILGDVPFIFDLYEDRGPLGGLHAALAYAETRWIFVIACDYPFVSAELIRFLAAKVSEDVGAVVPSQADGRLQPLSAFYRVATTRPVVEDLLSKPRVPPPLHQIVKAFCPLIVGFDEYSSPTDVVNPFLNVNTPEDLEAAKELERGPATGKSS